MLVYSVCILGDMLELGAFSEEAHKSVGEYAAEKNLDLLFCQGKEAKAIKDGAGDAVETKHFLDKAELEAALLETLRAGDVVLFKASRGMKLEEIIENLYKEWKRKNKFLAIGIAVGVSFLLAFLLGFVVK